MILYVLLISLGRQQRNRLLGFFIIRVVIIFIRHKLQLLPQTIKTRFNKRIVFQRSVIESSFGCIFFFHSSCKAKKLRLLLLRPIGLIFWKEE